MSTPPISSMRPPRAAQAPTPAPAQRSAQARPPPPAGPAAPRDSFEARPTTPVRRAELAQVGRAQQTQILERARASPDYAAAVHDLRRSPVWARNGAQLGRVLAQASPEGARDLAALGRANPSPLLSRDSQGHTMLSNLDRLATQPIDSRLSGWSRDGLVDGALADTARPSSINQGAAGSCGVTSVFQPLARDQPAEYARISADLATTGRAQLRGGPGTGGFGPQVGRTLEVVSGRPPEASDSLRGEARSATSRVLQNAALESANGPNVTYDPDRDRNSSGRTGVMSGQSGSLASQLYGTPYTSTPFTGSTARPAADVQPTLQQALGRSNARTGPVIATIGLDGGGSHAIEVQRLEGNVAVVRDPNGAQGAEAFPTLLPGAQATGEPGQYRVPVSRLAPRVQTIDAPVEPRRPSEQEQWGEALLRAQPPAQR